MGQRHRQPAAGRRNALSGGRPALESVTDFGSNADQLTALGPENQQQRPVGAPSGPTGAPGAPGARVASPAWAAEPAQRTGQQSAMPKADDPVVPSTDPLLVPRGQMTFDVEGMENPGGRFHSRVAEWPGGASGVTIGRGYDVGERTRTEVIGHMTAAGIPLSTAEAYAGACGKTHEAARNYLREHGDDLPGITLEQQNALFQVAYNQLAADVVRISDQYATTLQERNPRREKGDFEVDFEKVNPAIRDMLIDLRFRGDYIPATRSRVQPCAIANDLPALLKVMRDRDFWASVPKDRFDRRVAFLESAVNGGPRPSLTASGPVPEAAVRAPATGGQAVGAVGGERGTRAAVPAAAAPATGENTRSGASWVATANSQGWTDSTDFSTFNGTWGPKARAFVEGLRNNGADVTVTAGLRHPNRATLMHYAWHVAAGSKTAAAANADCRARGIAIEWDHGDATRTRSAANALKNAFGLVHAAALTSNHIAGLAMDLNIRSVPRSLTMNGKTYQSGGKGNGTLDEDKVDHIGRDMGVIWFGSGDWVHWSVDGH